MHVVKHFIRAPLAKKADPVGVHTGAKKHHMAPLDCKEHMEVSMGVTP